MKYRITHSTTYEYADAVSLSHNIARLRPRDSGLQQICLRHELSVQPAPSDRSDSLDYFGNHVSYFSLQESHNQLSITARSEVEITPALRPDFSAGAPWEEVRDEVLAGAAPETRAAREFTFDSPYVIRSAELENYALASFSPDRPFLECVLDLTERIHREFEFLPGATKVGTPVADVLRMRKGVCQDFAHLQLGCLRSFGFPARYVSGYIATTPPPGQRRLQGADVSHAWISVYAPGLGWIDFDPTNGLMPSDSHVTVGWARDYDDIGPVRGVVVGGRRQHLDVSVDVVPIDS
ncbi:MAG TPA: transglutaminase family protein [Candidatus Baltobacteraceae bacterium]|nr:transglutaminase family protein [Candidatus Baltobacteraceae bacterium]